MRINSANIVFIGLLSVCLAGCLSSCRKEDPVLRGEGDHVGGGESGEVKGFFLLNEGNMGSNKATLDYYDYGTGDYTRNIYPERNPGVALELGDVGNDLGIYGGKLYAVINCSNLVEVMDVETAVHAAQVSIPNCRYIAFDGGYAYVSSYAGAVEFDPEYRRGYVAKIDTVTMQVVDTCGVGYQPEEMAVVGDKLYVANSGGYRVPDYDSTVSVIDLASFKELYRIPVGINLHRLEPDLHGNLYVSSRGDYYSVPSRTFIIDTRTDICTDTLDLPNSSMTLRGDSLYVCSSGFNYGTQDWSVSYAIFNTVTRQTVTRSFITDDVRISTPYSIAVHPVTGEILITDAGDYVSPGTLHCFSSDGRRKWSVTTGDIPAHIVFTRKPLLYTTP